MCGIAGIVGENPSEEELDKMLFTQRHRGPDFTGKFCAKFIALGHNRLSILDLSAAANQPFFSDDKRYVLVLNGEIYNYLELKNELKNYPFKTASDTEVLLAAYIKWGEDCLHKLNGMFSFAIWDTHTNCIFAARDRFGVKPFYYFKKKDKLYFASEIKTLLAGGIPKKTNDKVWANYFVYGSYGMPDETFFEGIHQLPGGHFLKFHKNQLSIKKWYFFEEEIKKYQKKISFDQARKEYSELLESSIKLRFRADVPIGFNISGGVDSSALLAIVNKKQTDKNIQAYTFYTGNPNYDELPWVEEMIALTENPLTKVRLNVQEVAVLAKEISFYQDEPYGGIPTLAYGKIFNQAKSDGIKVLLDGQGMDEQWAGYDYYISGVDNLIQGVKSSPFKPQVLNQEFIKLAEKPTYPKLFEEHLLNLQYRDLFYTKIPRALRFNDRISMMYSTELREPFLDYRLVEFAFAQPLEYKINNGIQKFLLRSLVSENLSDSISYAPKRALQTPQREWLENELKDFVKLQLNKITNTIQNNWFNKKAIIEEWNNYLNGNLDSSFHIWQWVNLGLLINEEN